MRSERLGSEAVVSSSRFPLSEASANPDDDNHLTDALAQLDPGQRDALLLHALGELSYAEIAAAMDIPIGTVRSRISRACAALRAELEPPVTTGERRNHA